jgi:hypothetical protein
VLYLDHPIVDASTHLFGPGVERFVRSADGGRTWSPPITIGPGAGSVDVRQWWINGSLAIDAGGTLYAVWDTQTPGTDTGWLAYSTDHGAHWSNPIQVSGDNRAVPHVLEVAGGAAGTAYISIFSSADPRGYAEYLRSFTVAGERLSDVVRVSTWFGDTSYWPGDTFGISVPGPGKVALSWGMSPGSDQSEVVQEALVSASTAAP